MNKDIKKFNTALTQEYKKMCNILAEEICSTLPKAESKIWHGSPVWFLDGNPVVGYDKLKDCVRLLFWSGQSFDEKGLTKSGSFKAAEMRYMSVADIHIKDIKKWLKKAEKIQWDYKNIVKRKGKLIQIV